MGTDREKASPATDATVFDAPADSHGADEAGGDDHGGAGAPGPDADDEHAEMAPIPWTRTSGLPWLVALIVATVGAALYFSGRSELADERVAHDATQEKYENLTQRVEELEGEVETLRSDRDALAEEAAKAEAALAQMRATQTELEERLQAEVERGNVLISQQRGELVVDLLDKVVFDSGEAELNDKGREVLRQVGETLMKVPDKVLQISGHTDDLPISKKLVDRFPSNWELSAARAINVVHFLQDEVQIPGERLIAAGLAEFRPIASNRSASGRHRNRRIEVRLLPKPDPRP